MLSPDWLPATFSKVLHKRREALGISQEELSKRSGLHRTYISDVERGARNVSLKNMGRLSAALEVAPSVLIRWAEIVHAGETVNFSDTRLLSLSEPAGVGKDSSPVFVFEASGQQPAYAAVDEAS